MKLKGRFFSVFSAVIIVSAFLSALFLLNVFSEWQNKFVDNLYSQKKPLNNIIIIAIDDKSIQGIGRWPWNRSVWARIVDNIENASIIAFDVGFFEPSDSDDALARSFYGKNIILASKYITFETKNNSLIGKDIMLPVFNTSYAYINVLADKDGVVRSSYLGINNQPSFAEMIFQKYFNKKYDDRKGKVLINFVGRPGSFETIPAIDILNQKRDFNGKIVLIGATASDLHDSYFVPTSKGEEMSGVEIHANILRTIITKDYLDEINPTLTLMIILLVSILTSLFVINFRPLLAAFFSLLLIVLYIFVSILVFSGGVIMNLVYPVLSIIFSHAAVSGVLYITEERKKKEVLEVFGKYVSKNVVDEIFRGDEVIDLKGVEKDITVLFADIRGFTTISEKLNAHDVVRLLNKYLGKLTDIVFKHEGTLDKYMGDALMAIFNAPKDIKNHELKACMAALEMQKEIEIMNKSAGNKVFIGIGINSGKAVVGNIGSDVRKEYTAIGDNVNLASRIEGLTRQYNVSIIISESVYEKVKDFVIARDLDLVKVKGKTRTVRIYELRSSEYDKRWDQAISYYRQGRFSEAKRLFDMIKDETSKVFSERCATLIREKPKNWDGVYEFKTK